MCCSCGCTQRLCTQIVSLSTHCLWNLRRQTKYKHKVLMKKTTFEKQTTCYCLVFAGNIVCRTFDVVGIVMQSDEQQNKKICCKLFGCSSTMSVYVKLGYYLFRCCKLCLCHNQGLIISFSTSLSNVCTNKQYRICFRTSMCVHEISVAQRL